MMQSTRLVGNDYHGFKTVHSGSIHLALTQLIARKSIVCGNELSPAQQAGIQQENCYGGEGSWAST